MTQPIQPVPDGSDVTLGELARGLNSIRDQISLLRTDAVLRVEFEPRMTAMDREIRDMKAAMKDRDDKVERQKPSWTAVVSTIATVIGLVLTILLLIFVAR